MFFLWSLHLTRPSHPGHSTILLRSESQSGMCAKLHTVATSNNRNHTPRSFYYCLFAPHVYGVILRSHSVRGEPHIQRNASEEVATASPRFYNETNRSHVLFFVKAAPGTTFASWSQHHFDAIGKPEWHVRKASHCGSKQQ